ncbi:glycosyltransferase [Priestia aryabhattai]|uniref:glycosyltransferase n=1 Tax=Priestia aryabhattai TaxID=412384 RepID=UPI0023802771|nr:glycosyltransferase [Priestia aryabhattai]WDW10072.1 hypothetical protein PWC21_05810 [Priestia aryabhattai]
MKILYLAAVDYTKSRDIGVINKINGQVKALINLGFVVDKCFYSENAVYLNGEKLFEYHSKYKRRVKLYRDIYRNANSYDCIYIRYDTSDPFFLYYLKKLKFQMKKVILEIPTYPYDGERVNSNVTNKVSNWIDIVYRKKLHKYVDYIVTFMKHNEIWGIPVISIKNAIDLDAIEYTGYHKKQKDIRLVAVANISKWHGYDRIIDGLHQYYLEKPNRNVLFDLVGEGGELNNLKKLVKNRKMEHIVKFHGSSSGLSLTKIFSSAQIAIGSLGMSRIGIENGSTLKAKEYTARGIPFLLGYNDTSFNKEEFIFYVSNDDTKIDIKEIVKFYDGLKIEGRVIRDVAQKEFGWEEQMKKVFYEVMKK